MSEDEIIQYIEEHFDEVYKEAMEDCDDEEIFVYQYIIKKFKKEMEQEKEKNSKIQKYVRSNEWAEDYEKSSCRTKILRILEE